MVAYEVLAPPKSRACNGAAVEQKPLTVSDLLFPGTVLPSSGTEKASLGFK